MVGGGHRRRDRAGWFPWRLTGVVSHGPPAGECPDTAISVYDLWVEQWRTRHAKGDMIVVYTDGLTSTAGHRCHGGRWTHRKASTGCRC